MVPKFLRVLFMSVPRTTPAQSGADIHAGRSVLIDVREATEWSDGVAEKATLLPLSDLYRARRIWRPFLATVGDRELVLYCGAGVRSNFAARVLKAEGFRVANGGGLADWESAGWPVVPPPKPQSFS